MWRFLSRASAREVISALLHKLGELSPSATPPPCPPLLSRSQSRVSAPASASPVSPCSPASTTHSPPSSPPPPAPSALTAARAAVEMAEAMLHRSLPSHPLWAHASQQSRASARRLLSAALPLASHPLLFTLSERPDEDSALAEACSLLRGRLSDATAVAAGGMACAPVLSRLVGRVEAECGVERKQRAVEQCWGLLAAAVGGARVGGGGREGEGLVESDMADLLPTMAAVLSCCYPRRLMSELRLLVEITSPPLLSPAVPLLLSAGFMVRNLEAQAAHACASAARNPSSAPPSTSCAPAPTSAVCLLDETCTTDPVRLMERGVHDGEDGEGVLRAARALATAACHRAALLPEMNHQVAEIEARIAADSISLQMEVQRGQAVRADALSHPPPPTEMSLPPLPSSPLLTPPHPGC